MTLLPPAAAFNVASPHTCRLQHPWLLGDVMHIALMHRRAVYPLLEVGDAAVRGTVASIDAALGRLLLLAQASLKDMGLASRVREKGIDCALMTKAKQLKFRLKFELVSKEALQLMDHSDSSSSEIDDDACGSLSRSNSSCDASFSARSVDREGHDAGQAQVQLPPRLGSRTPSSSFDDADAVAQDDQQQWLVSAELIIGDPPQFDKVFRKLCAKCSPPGMASRARAFAFDRAVWVIVACSCWVQDRR
jgi:hypothetical protein